MHFRFFAILSLVLSCVAAPAVRAQARATELPGAKDPALVGRYAGAVLQNASQEAFAAVRVAAGPGRYAAGKFELDKSIAAEGRVGAYFYVAPKERTALEVFRNYQNALARAGFVSLYACEMRACDDALIKEPYAGEILRVRKWSANRTDGSAISRDIRFLSAKMSRDGADTYALVFVGEPDSIYAAPMVALVLVEPAAMEGGKVLVNTERLQKGLADEGRIALYGIYFDTGRAELKPESTPQLDEMGRLLAADKALRVAIVGHTDNQGTVESNLALSQRRAEAVVAALAGRYKVDAGRLRARGVASFAPVASNRSEAGRAKNRRVELVEQ